MNRPVLEVLVSIAGDFYCDAVERYPCLFLHASDEPDDEALIVWRVLVAIDELVDAAHAAIAFDNEQRAPQTPAIEETLPF